MAISYISNISIGISIERIATWYIWMSLRESARLPRSEDTQVFFLLTISASWTPQNASTSHCPKFLRKKTVYYIPTIVFHRALLVTECPLWEVNLRRHVHNYTLIRNHNTKDNVMVLDARRRQTHANVGPLLQFSHRGVQLAASLFLAVHLKKKWERRCTWKRFREGFK